MPSALNQTSVSRKHGSAAVVTGCMLLSGMSSSSMLWVEQRGFESHSRARRDGGAATQQRGKASTGSATSLKMAHQ